MDRTNLAALIVDRLDRDRAPLTAAFAAPQGTRTRHAVVDDLLPADIAHDIAQGFGAGGGSISCGATAFVSASVPAPSSIWLRRS